MEPTAPAFRSSQSTPRVSGRIERLDVLRALAAIGVYLFHFTLYPAQVGEVTGWAVKAITMVGKLGSAGVALFFIISGFCIHTGFLAANRAFVAKTFFRRRFVRLYPTYLVVLIVFSLCCLFHRTRWWDISFFFSGLNLKMFLSHLLLVHNLFDLPTMRSIDTPMWSLAVEAQFYALFPLLLWARHRWKLKTCLYFTFSWIVIYQMACLAWPALSSVTEVHCMAGRTVFTWCTWILGAVLAESYAKGERFFGTGWGVVATGIAVMAVGRAGLFLSEFTFCCDALLGAILLERYINLTRGMNVSERLLVPVGLISYSIYLWHMPLLTLAYYGLHQVLALPAEMAPLVYLPLSLALLSPVFIGSYFLLERRFSRWVGEKLFGRTEPRERTVPVLPDPLTEAGK